MGKHGAVQPLREFISRSAAGVPQKSVNEVFQLTVEAVRMGALVRPDRLRTFVGTLLKLERRDPMRPKPAKTARSIRERGPLVRTPIAAVWNRSIEAARY
jgi:hypothetical protein